MASLLIATGILSVIALIIVSVVYFLLFKNDQGWLQ